MRELEDSLLLAVLACEALHGEASVRLGTTYEFDASHRSCQVSADTEAGRDLNRIFTGFLTREFGPDSFRVEPLGEDAIVTARARSRNHRRRSKQPFTTI